MRLKPNRMAFVLTGVFFLGTSGASAMAQDRHPQEDGRPPPHHEQEMNADHPAPPPPDGKEGRPPAKTWASSTTTEGRGWERR